MKKNCKYFILGILLIIGYVGFIFIQGRDDKVGHDPQITVPQTPLTVSVTSEESVLLQDVSASDEEDGDLTSQVFIESISAFQENQTRTITYAVFDSDDNLIRATRQLSYSDYQAPQITLTKALAFQYLESNDSLKDYVSASSVVDGDLTSQIAIENVEYTNDSELWATFSVTDSCGTASSLRLKGTYLNSQSNIEIELTEYLIRVPVGTAIRPMQYVSNVTFAGVSDSSLEEEIEVTNNYDPSAPGTYEFIYRISQGADTGYTKLVVIAE